MEQQMDVLNLFSKFASQVEKGKKLPPITMDAKIRDFGIDSVAMMEIIGRHDSHQFHLMKSKS